MGKRSLVGFYNKYNATTWTKKLDDIEAPINKIFINSVELTEKKTIDGYTYLDLADDEWIFDYLTFEMNIKLPSGTDPNDEVMVMETFFLIIGKYGTNAQLISNEIFQVFKPTVNLFLKYVRIPLFFYSTGASGFTNLKMEIRPVDANDLPKDKILATSINDLSTIDFPNKKNTLFDLYFEFNDFGLKANQNYALVLKATDVNFGDNYHLAWLVLEPIYTAGLDIDTSLITEGPLRFSIIGRKQ